VSQGPRSSQSAASQHERHASARAPSACPWVRRSLEMGAHSVRERRRSRSVRGVQRAESSLISLRHRALCERMGARDRGRARARRPRDACESRRARMSSRQSAGWIVRHTAARRSPRHARRWTVAVVAIIVATEDSPDGVISPDQLRLLEAPPGRSTARRKEERTLYARSVSRPKQADR